MKRKILTFWMALLLLSTAASGMNLPPAEPLPSAQAEQEFLREHLPVMDGSTSLIPLEAGIRAALFGISPEEASGQVRHTTTHASFSNLLDGKADLIFSVPLSENQTAFAAERGIELEQVPVAREGFVFVVNAQNPVDTLSQQQLKDIYSGKITNWKEVGGKDEPIRAYQRNRDSGSQNFMVSFMGDTPLMDAPAELRPASMFGLMDVLAVNDYAPQSIGYSVYTYAAEMYGNGEQIKFIAVDGVEPNLSTMAAGNYPLLADNYAIFRADEPENSAVRRLCAWICSDEGQRIVAESGYVPVREIGTAGTEREAPAGYSGTGAGPERWDAPVWECTAWDGSESYSQSLPLNIQFPENFSPSESRGTLIPYTTGLTYTLDCLTDRELQEDVNRWIAGAVSRADSHCGELYDLIASMDTNLYRQTMVWMEGGKVYAPSTVVTAKAKNGYLWVTAEQKYQYDVQDGYDKYYRTESTVWDMFTGEQLPMENLFRGGMDVGAFLNDFVRKASQSPVDSWGIYPSMKTEFARLPESGWTFSPEAIYFDRENPYFAEGIRFSLEQENGVLCTEMFRDMSGLFCGNAVCAVTLRETPERPVYTYFDDGFFEIQLLDETSGNSEVRAAVNADFLSRLDGFRRENAAAYFESQGLKEGEWYLEPWYFWGVRVYGGRFAVFTSYGGCITAGVDSGESYTAVQWPDSRGTWFYDLQTGERLEWQDLLADGWEQQAKFITYDEQVNEIMIPELPDVFSPLSFCNLNSRDDNGEPQLLFSFETEPDGGRPQFYYLHLPLSALRIAAEGNIF